MFSSAETTREAALSGPRLSRWVAALAAAAAVWVAPATAAAVDCGSPENAAIHQYCEDVPSVRSGAERQQGGDAQGPRLSVAERRELTTQGRPGQGVLALVDDGGESSGPSAAPAPTPTRAARPGSPTRSGGGAHGERRPRSTAPEAPEPAVQEGGMLAAFRTAAGTDAGGLWLLLGGTTLALLLAALIRRRSS